MADPFAAFADSPSAPSRAPFAVTPHDTNALATVPKALYIGGAGNVALRGAGSSTDVTFMAVPAGFLLDVAAAYVRATGTTATNIVALA